MAQIIDYYTAEMAARWYIYPDAYTMQDGTQYEPGTELILPANYAERGTNGRYPVTSPESGWLNWTYISNLTPVYKTVTDKCTPPDSLSIDTALKILTIIGGAGGDLNVLTGFGVSWREREISGAVWSSWSAEAASASRTVSVTASAGKVRQYRVRTQGSAGSSYYSDWMVCETLVSGNTAARTPVILLPANEAVTGSKTPVIVLSCGADAEGDAMSLQRSIDGAEWTETASVDSEGGTVYDRLPTLEAGRHTIGYRLVDANAAESETTAVSIVCGDAEWTREIRSGDVISNREISHTADITEMLNAVNVQRLYYGLDVISLPGTVGLFRDWGRQMEALLAAANACHASAGQASVQNTISDTWPNAETINQIRQKILSV